MSKEKLFCFSYAGGSYTFYEGHFQGLKEAYEIITPDYSGHGTKFGMPLNESMDELVDEVYNEVIEKLSKTESYCLFGYSLGCIVAYEIAWRLRDAGYTVPRRMFLCSMRAPRLIPRDEWIHELSDEDFLNEMISSGGIDEELAADPLMIEVFLPVLRNDFKIFELYDVKKRDILNTGALIMYSADDIGDDDIRDWDSVIADTEYICYPGGHFFINDRYDEVVGEVLKRRKIQGV